MYPWRFGITIAPEGNTMGKITSKGQVTVPKWARDELGVAPGDEVEFVQENGAITLQKTEDQDPFRKWYGYLRDKVAGKSTDELIRGMRGE